MGRGSPSSDCGQSSNSSHECALKCQEDYGMQGLISSWSFDTKTFMLTFVQQSGVGSAAGLTSRSAASDWTCAIARDAAGLRLSTVPTL